MGRGTSRGAPATAVMRGAASASNVPPSPRELTDVDVVVRELLYHFPGLTASPDRTSILLYALSSGGNGFEWHDGRLANIFDYDAYRREKPLLRDPQDEFERMLAEERARHNPRPGDEVEEISDFIRESLLEQATAKAGNVAHVHDNLDDLMRQRQQPDRITVISKSAPLANIPDDASDAWLEACEETAHVLLAGTRTTYLYDGDLDPKPAAPLAERERMGAAVAEVMGVEPHPLPSDEELQTEMDVERQMRVNANDRAIASNHAIARMALGRIAELRAQRAV
jgi:hypothetical protein